MRFKIRFKVVRALFCLLAFALVDSASASETEDRVAEFILNWHEISKGMSVGIRMQSIHEVPDGSIQTAEILQRMIVCDGGRRQRIDAQIGSLSASFSADRNYWESMLFLPTECLHVSNVDRDSSVHRYQVKAEQSEARARSHRVEPFALATTNHHSALSDGTLGIFKMRFSVIAEDELKSEKFRSVILHENNLAAYIVVFAKEPKWGPESIEFYFRDKMKLPDGRKVEEKDIMAWDHRSTTRTTWFADDEHACFLPKSVSMQGTTLSNSTLCREYEFVDWKFGKELSEELLDTSHFTEKEIPRQTDFVALRSKFEKKR